VRIPRFSRHARFGFHKICRKTGEFAEAIGVVVEDPERAFASRVAGATNGRPITLETSLTAGSKITSVDTAQRLLQSAGYVADAYDLKLHAVALARASHAAYAA
jgi:aerobic carbon-monoxide dehydrogenase medium subunit